MGAHQHHDHDHDHDHEHHEGLRKAVAITATFMLIEAVGGWISNSLALISDAGHMLTDLGGLLLALFAGWMARRPPSSRLSFGYHRAEILGALASGLLIWMLAGVLVNEAIGRFQNPQPVEGAWAFGVAAVGLVANLMSLRALHGHHEEHLHVRGAYLHVAADAAGSVGAMISAGLILWRGWYWADSVMTLILAVLMLAGSWSLIRDAVVVLMESTPAGLDPGAVRAALAGLEGVSEVHDLHIWTVGSGRKALSVHLISSRGESLLEAANGVLESRFGIIHTTIQIEHPERFSSERCYDCHH